jgi:hypothetical protein
MNTHDALRFTLDFRQAIQINQEVPYKFGAGMEETASSTKA